MANCMKNIDPGAGVLLEIAGIDPSLRPEQIDILDWCLLANVYKHSIFFKPPTEKTPKVTYDFNKVDE